MVKGHPPQGKRSRAVFAGCRFFVDSRYSHDSRYSLYSFYSGYIGYSGYQLITHNYNSKNPRLTVKKTQNVSAIQKKSLTLQGRASLSIAAGAGDMSLPDMRKTMKPTFPTSRADGTRSLCRAEKGKNKPNIIKQLTNCKRK